MQNLFLETFEQLKGILIATTNLKDNLDTAFSRRFHLRLDFPLPELRERLALWKLYLPDTLPKNEDINIISLAGEFKLSRGQIKLIINNAATEAACRKGKKQILMQADLEKYCKLESLSTFDHAFRHPIGFIT